MKKLLFIVAALAVTATASAQLSYGLKGGLNLASVSDSKDMMMGDDTGMRFSIYAGAFAEYQISDFFGVAGEILYSGQGARGKGTEQGVEWKDTYRFSYLNVPILAKVYLMDGLSLDLGPQFGFLLGAKDKEEAGGQELELDVKNEMEKFDLSIGMGLTYNICDNIFVQGRYNLGLTDTAKNNSGDNKYKNGVIQLGVGYRF